MATRSRARMFHATAKALHAAAEQRVDGTGEVLLTAHVEDIALGEELDIDAQIVVAPELLTAASRPVTRDELEHLHAEFRWAESKLMQASERLAEAQEARRKDLVALACMRRELRASFDCERAYVQAQLRLLTAGLPVLRTREDELAELVDGGALIEQVIRELAGVRAERKLYELSVGQIHSQLARIDDAEHTLEYEVASEAYDRDPDGRTMRELARLRSLSTRSRRAATRMRSEAAELRGQLGLDRAPGEITAAAAFIAAEIEGDARAKERMTRLRAWLVGNELRHLPEPTSAWKTGLRHPVKFMKSRRV